MNFMSKIIGKAQLKMLIKEVLNEYSHRFGTAGEWIEPNGKVHDVGRKIHYVWADEYLKSNNIDTNKQDPFDYLINRGWVRVIYSYNESLIMITKKGKLTRQQLEHLEDQSEETEWAVKDDDGYLIYKPYFCKTPDEYLNENIDALYHNQSAPMSQCSGFQYDVSIPDITQMTRDPLNDPELNGKMNEQYKFDDFKWLARQDGFGIPTDVYYGSVLLGVIVSSPEGYMIGLIKGPKNDITIKKSPKNMYKTKNDAAQSLHQVWKQLRYIGEIEPK